MISIAKNKLFTLLTILIVIFCSGHALQTIYSQLGYAVIPYAALILLIELCVRRNFSLDRSQLAVLLFGVTIFCTAMVYMGAGISFYFIQMCYIITAYGISRLYGFRQMVNCYLRIMTVVTAIALVGYFLVQNTDLLEMLPVMKNVNDVEYRVGIIFNYIPVAADRNCGMFWEPGLFATNLIIAIIFELLCREKTNALRLVLFSIGVFTANSSAGFALWLLCVILLFVKKNDAFKNIFTSLIGIFVLFVGIAVIASFDQILAQTSLGDNEYLQKLSTDSILDSSRIKAIEHNLKTFLSAPIFGVGISGARQVIQHVADTSTSTYMLSVFGLMGGLFTVYWPYAIFKRVPKNLLVKCLLTVIALIILNKEPHQQNLMTWCILFYLLNGDFSPLEHEEEKTRKRKLVLRWR